MGRPLKKDINGVDVIGDADGNTGVRVEFYDASLRTDGAIVKQRGAKTFVCTQDANVGSPNIKDSTSTTTCVLKDGTPSVPEIDYGPDPLIKGYNNGTPAAKNYLSAIPMGQAAQGNIPGGLIPQMIAGGGNPMDMLKQVSPILALGGALGLKDGTSCAGMNCNCASCKARKYNNGTMSVKPTTNMAYADGVDSVPSMLTPGEAVIPAPAAQNPANKPMIDSMINEGRAANNMAEGMPAGIDMTVMAGPLSGKAKREQMKLLQDMSFKKKAFEAEEQRKQQAFDQKMSQSKMQYMLSMRQSQE